MERRLAAILAADVAGYSRLVERDEEGTVARLRAHRRELIDPAIAAYRGRLVKTTGDGLLVEFASAVDALRCALAVQRGMAERNAAAPSERRMDLRIGINSGDVIVDGDDLLGDGVNVAARLEALAEPGAICVSGRVREDAAGKVEVGFEDSGEQRLKNIERPVRVYRVRAGTEGSAAPAGIDAPLALPDRPSIAVLPFANMSGDPEQEYFTDGISEDIITELSRFRSLFVIARNSSFTYKGKPVDVKQVGRELGVRYVLEGSIRRAANRVRVTAQLIDATTGSHIWAEKYDRVLEDIFAVQEEVTQAIVAAMAPHIEASEFERMRQVRPGSLDAYELAMRGWAAAWTALGDPNDRDTRDEALRCAREALA
ncbi:MAG: adenylate/guanylate cyclase domain-containing protein, partial [Alphaproteobacteria bacterium]|nr:adenylate/guanylate cyclase domain-containing protein [Alphaproteobacteria bacterium]